MKNKKNLLRNKNAEITTQQIVMLIVLLASFVVLLFFLFKINFQELSEKEICQSSIQLAGKASFFAKIDCKTDYICISGGGECKDFTAKKIISIVPGDKTLKNQIMKALADEMVDCWWMFGEGKVDYVDSSFTGNTACAVCAEIAFDEKLIGGAGVDKWISYDDFYTFLKDNYVDKDKTQKYSDYLKLASREEMNKFYTSKSIFFDKKYGIYTGRDKAGWFGRAYSWVVGNSDEKLKGALPPVILERNQLNTSPLKCSSFVTTP